MDIGNIDKDSWYKITRKIANIKFFRWLFHEGNYLLERELLNCKSVLDIGCGNNSPIQNSGHLTYSVGVEPDLNSLKQSRKKKIHDRYINKKIEEIEFPAKSFDAVVIWGVLEHMPYKTGLKILKKSEKWAGKKVIIHTPNGFHPQKNHSHNDYQAHLSGWGVNDLKRIGYGVRGITGAKIMYKKGLHTYNGQYSKYSYDNLRFYPKQMAFIVNALLEIFVYYIPSQAFQLFASKKL